MCEFHESTCNGFGDIWWTDNPIYFSSIDRGLDMAEWIRAWDMFEATVCGTGAI